MQLILFGAPGVGKGTQAKILAEKNKLFHISTGDILREAVKNGTELGKAAKSIMEKGELVPDEIIAGIVKEALQSDKAKNGFILDGYPRTVDQAKMLDAIFTELKIDNVKLVIVDAEDSILIDRITGRRICTSCGYILSKGDILKDNKCPSCGSIDSFVKRKDDNEEVVKRRLAIYHETTIPVLDYFKGKAEYISVDGTQEIEKVTHDILAKLK
jgi:adenylate kinase